MSRILVLAPEPVPDASRIGGTTIRAFGLARHLADAGLDVTLGVPGSGAPRPAGWGDSPAVTVTGYTRASAGRAMAGHDVVIAQLGTLPARMCATPPGRGPKLVFDLYSPFWLEMEASDWRRGQAPPISAAPQPGDGLPRPWPRAAAHLSALLRLVLDRADLVLCATPQQRDLYLGAMPPRPRAGGLGTDGADSENGPVLTVPLGHDGGPGDPWLAYADRARGTGEKSDGERPGIIWGGGLWNWLDPLTAIRAMARLADEEAAGGGLAPRLVFLGTDPPPGGPGPHHLEDTHSGASSMAGAARELADALGLTARGIVEFRPGWTPFSDRGRALIGAALALCMAPDTTENHFSFRTRLVDALWAGLPTVASRGGWMSDYLAATGSGVAVPCGDDVALAEAIARALTPEEQARMRSAVAKSRVPLEWDRCVAPLAAWLIARRGAGAGRIDQEADRGGRAEWAARYAKYKISALAAMARSAPDAG